jgi:hypothetical protein
MSGEILTCPMSRSAVPLDRRRFLRATGAAVASGLFLPSADLQTACAAQEPGARPAGPPPGVTVMNPAGRVPVALIIDDSTCLVNLAHFGIPQFHEVFPNEYKQPWKTLPREIPDSFVRRFGEWCATRGIKGKYSMVPYPACVGWLDRDLPGWSKQDLASSLELVRTLMAPNWDIHPEMVSHTWVIDTKTGRPFPNRTSDFMENWGWSVGKSADQLADYMGYALKILKNAGFSCEGITTPGGFGNRVLPALAQATLEACRDVCKAEILHYFRHIFTDGTSVAPRVELAAGLDGADPRCVVSMIGCTGDWFGGWDGLTPGSVEQFITADLKHGRLPEVIARGEPAILVCHWPGMYFNGQETGFKIFQEVVKRLDEAYDHLTWMKLSEIARYWAARELTRIERPAAGSLTFHAPFACPQFTVRLEIDDQTAAASSRVRQRFGEKQTELTSVGAMGALKPGSMFLKDRRLVVCLDLPRGLSHLELY